MSTFNHALPYRPPFALLIVDFATAYTDPQSPFYLTTHFAALNQTSKLLQWARALHISIFHSMVEYDLHYPLTTNLFVQKIPALATVFASSSHFRLPPSTLTPLPGEVLIKKQYASAFFQTSLARGLAARQIGTVIIAGLSASGCVRASAIDALQYGYSPIVISDATADRSESVLKSNLQDLDAKYANVMTLLELQTFINEHEKD